MTETDLSLTITDKINPATECLIESGLAEYNHALAGYTDARPLVVLISDSISKEAVGGLIPNPTDQNRCAQSRNPIDMIVQGWSTSLFQAKQQCSRMSS